MKTINVLNKKDYFKYDHSDDNYVYLGYARTSDLFGDMFNVFNINKQRVEVAQHNERVIHLGTYDKLVIK